MDVNMIEKKRLLVFLPYPLLYHPHSPIEKLSSFFGAETIKKKMCMCIVCAL